jgi:very-short-patch-repair endonuclease
MRIQTQRLLALIEYVQQLARTRSKVISNITDHSRFLLFEHQLSTVDGVRLDDHGPEGDDEIWLSVPRPPGPEVPPGSDNPWLAPWLSMGVALLVAPQLAAAVDGEALIAAGTHRDASGTADDLSELAKPAVAANARVPLAGYAFHAEVERQFATYLDRVWQPWAESEQRRRRLSRMYVQLFTLQQELAGAMTEGLLELVWGVGFTVWKQGGITAAYPLVTRLVDLSFDPETGAAQIRPRDVDARLELDFYAAVDRPGVAQAERLAREQSGRAPATFSPFDRASYEPLLAIARDCLQAGGDAALKISDGWVLFARARNSNVMLQDLERLALAARAGEAAGLPAAVAALVSEPAAEATGAELPRFRGLSVVNDDPAGAAGADLYFPKPFNQEQVRMVQLLEAHDGVVVQGPPGTGKTHTIANLICHWLANGRRVLVTSMKEPALAVLREKLPEQIRPLAICLLSSDQEGMQQFEQSIRTIALQVQSMDPEAAAREVAKLDETIDALQARLARVDADIGRWARLNLARIELEDGGVTPAEAAEQVAGAAPGYEWIPDALGVGPQYAPRFTDADLARLREARRELGADLAYVGCELPALDVLPEPMLLLRTHQDLLRFARLSDPARTAEVAPLADASQPTLAQARSLIGDIERLRALRRELRAAGREWTASLRERLRRGTQRDEFELLEALGRELEQAAAKRQAFLARPVSMPAAQPPVGFVQAVDNLARGKRPFGLSGVFGKADERRHLEQVRISGQGAALAGDWRHVANYLALQEKWRELAVRWNTLAPELGLEQVMHEAGREGVAAAEQFALYRKVAALVDAEADLTARAARLFPGWNMARRLSDDDKALEAVERALDHHLTISRLGDVWAVRDRLQRALENVGGPVAEELRRFVSSSLGSAALDDQALLAQWSALRGEVARLRALLPTLGAVRAITEQVAASGAPLLAQRLRQPGADPLPAGGWLADWRRKRLAGHLAAIDSQDELKKLSRLRRDLEHDLARTYHDVVVGRAWLELTRRATPGVRAALQAYLSAIQRIGKGTGKRAARYRQDARNAAAQATQAVPCWIMPHYRVSESLPPELGCFDLVVIDEASQSDLSALPAMLRARKLLIVGDDRQVSPEGVGLDEERIKAMMQRHLADQVPLYRAQLSPERSIYDLARVVFAHSGVMLKEHFRCVAPIIEYSKREFYDHALQPLRLPRASERLEPALVDVYVADGQRTGGVNPAEIEFIVGEIRRLTLDPRTCARSIGVVSLLGEEQALRVWDALALELGAASLQQHAIACGDARAFQGRERDIIFLSMVSAPNDVGAALSRDIFAQRFNVAASRARDRMYLVRSVGLEHLSEADRLRRGLIAHFAQPFREPLPHREARELCESPLERALFDWLTQRGYRVIPQAQVGAWRVDLVVEGAGDARLAIECDGDKYHRPEQWTQDMRRQRALERVGWVFWRCFAASFTRRPEAVLGDLAAALAEQAIEPFSRPAPQAVERRVVLRAQPVEPAPSAAQLSAVP